LFFCQTERELPSLHRGWRTPDPSPTRDAAGLPGCALRLCIAEPTFDEYPAVPHWRGNVVGPPAWTSRTPSPSPARPQLPMPQSWNKFGMEGNSNEDSMSTPRMQWPQTIRNAKVQRGPVELDVSPSAAMSAQALIQEENILAGDKAGEDSKSKPAEAFVECMPTVSVGSVGHPHTCAEPCKYVRKKRRGCKDGSACVRCHLCEWKRRYTDKGEKGHSSNSSKGNGQGGITTDTAVQPEGLASK